MVFGKKKKCRYCKVNEYEVPSEFPGCCSEECFSKRHNLIPSATRFVSLKNIKKLRKLNGCSQVTQVNFLRMMDLNNQRFPSERMFEEFCKTRNESLVFHKNLPLLSGKYFGDFVDLKKRIVIEIDGSSHEGKKDYDLQRDLELESKKWRVLRLKTSDHFHWDKIFTDFLKNKRVKKSLSIPIVREWGESRKEAIRRAMLTVSPDQIKKLPFIKPTLPKKLKRGNKKVHPEALYRSRRFRL